MKKILFFSLLIMGIGLISMTDQGNQRLSSLIITSVNDEPTLPEQPYEYATKLPSHLVQSFSNGYYSTVIDTTILPLINNNTATLGRVLFYDKVLSANENMSCGSCHIQNKSFADKHAVSIGVSEPTKRNSMHLNDLGWSNNTSHFWDMRASNLPNAIKLPLQDPNEIGATLEDLLYKMSDKPYYTKLFTEAFGTSEITEERIIEALDDFIKSMVTFDTKFDQVSRDETSFTAQEQRGLKIFEKKCGGCHVQGVNRFIDLLNIKDKSIRTFNGYTSKTGDKGMTQNITNLLPLFKMPTLRNIEFTGPYMHDGGIETLEEVIDFYSEEVAFQNNITINTIPATGFNFNPDQKADLLSFLKTLSSKDLLENPKWSNPFSSTTGTKDLAVDVSISPNPTFDAAVIRVDQSLAGRKDVLVTDMNGRVIDQDYFMDSEYRLDTQHFAKGMYLVSIRQGDALGTYKLMVN